MSLYFSRGLPYWSAPVTLQIPFAIFFPLVALQTFSLIPIFPIFLLSLSGEPGSNQISQFSRGAFWLVQLANPVWCQLPMVNQFGKCIKSATLQNFATFARRSSTAVHNSHLWPLENAALLNFATMRIYAIFLTERKGFVVCCHAVVLSLRSIDFFKMYWNFRANQWYNQIQFYKIQLLCEIEEYWRIFHDVIAENGPFFFGVLFDGCDLNQHRFPQTNWCSD